MRMLKNRIADDSLWTLRYDSRRQGWSISAATVNWIT